VQALFKRFKSGKMLFW